MDSFVLSLELLDLFYRLFLFLLVILDDGSLKLIPELLDFLFEGIFVRLVQSFEMFPQSFLILFDPFHANFKLRVPSKEISQIFLQESVSVISILWRHDIVNFSFCLFVLWVIVCKSSNWNLCTFILFFFLSLFLFRWLVFV